MWLWLPWTLIFFVVLIYLTTLQGIPVFYFYLSLIWFVAHLVDQEVSKNWKMKAGLVILVSLLYLTLLFVIAIYANKQNRLGRSLVNNPYIYAFLHGLLKNCMDILWQCRQISCSGYRLHGSVPGSYTDCPDLYQITRKMVLISKHQRITSIIDFISSRYSKVLFWELLPPSFLYLNYTVY